MKNFLVVISLVTGLMGGSSFAQEYSGITVDGNFDITFQKELDNVLFDATSGKSALEQFLEKGFTLADLYSPYRWMYIMYSLGDLDGNIVAMRVLYPHRLEVDSEWSKFAHSKLLESDKLAAAVYREVIDHAHAEMPIHAGKFGIWNCTQECIGNYYVSKN